MLVHVIKEDIKERRVKGHTEIDSSRDMWRGKVSVAYPVCVG